MNFLSPAFLAGFLLLIPVIALYFLKTRPRLRPVSSNIIWRIVVSRVNPNSFLQRFHNSLFLLLQVFAIILAVLATARPVGGLWAANQTNRIIILDISASMQAEDVLPSRFALAQDRAAQLSREFSGRVALYFLGHNLMPVVRYTDATDAVVQVAMTAKPSHQATPSPERVLRLMRDLEGLSPDEIFLLTDTLDLDVPRDFMPQTALTVETFGRDEANVALVGAEMTFAEAGKGLNIAASVMSENNIPVEVNLSFIGEDGHQERLVTTTLPNRGVHTVNLPLLPTLRGTILLEAAPEGNTSHADDRWFFCDPQLKPTVGIAAPERSMLFRLPRALPLISFFRLGASMPAILPDALIGEGSLPFEARKLPTCAFLPGLRPSLPGEVLPWESDHPLLRFANWDAAPKGCLVPASLPGTPLVEAVGGPLLSEEATTIDSHTVPHVWVAMDPNHPALRGNFFLPILLFNVLEYLLHDKFPRLSYPVGDPGLAALWGTSPPDTAGLHQVQGGKGNMVAVNLESPSEARLKPARPQTPTARQIAARTGRDLDASPWKAILTAGFLLVLGEWFLYMRRN